MPEQRKLHDKFFKLAKAEGYVARSAYKLLEIQERYNLIRPGMRVLDLGCAPGSWLQVVEKLIGRQGVAAGIDLQEVKPAFGRNVHTTIGDIFKTPAEMFLGPTEGRLYDLVISDMAPNTTGHADDFASVNLCRRVLELLPTILRPQGACVMKVLEGAAYPELLAETKALFRFVKGLKPEASRDVSREMFIIAEGYRPPSKPAPKPDAPTP